MDIGKNEILIMDPVIPTAAPSAAAPAAATPAAPTPAPSAEPGKTNLPKTLDDYAQLALESMTAEPPAAPAAAPAAQPATPEPGAEPPVATPGQEPSPAAAPAAPAPASPDADEPEVPEAEQAAWSEGEKRLYGALKKEREARKAAKKELGETKATLETLTAKVEELTKPKTPEAKPTEAAPAVPVPGQPLAHCKTFEAVDAEVAEAGRVELLAYDLQQALTRGDRNAVQTALTAEKVTQFEARDGSTVTLADATDGQLGDFISSLYKGSRITQSAAQPRKVYLQHQAASMQEAVTLIPELADLKSPQFAQFRSIIQANPAFQIAGPNWPSTVARWMLGDVAAGTKLKKAPASTPAAVPVVAKTEPVKPEIVPPAPTRKVPGAPIVAGAPTPQKTASDAAREKIHGSGATLADVVSLARAGIVG